mmetsp:Transcript_1652/g.3818  ORF Transcript_1652/g.3818 Transcript_1652/m.3818 type:complete len:201 (-) Transcript_1652:1035-1637(-)
MSLLLLDVIPWVVGFLLHHTGFEGISSQLLRFHELLTKAFRHQHRVLLINVAAHYGSIHVIQGVHQFRQVVVQVIHLLLMLIAPHEPPSQIHVHLLKVARGSLTPETLNSAEKLVGVDLPCLFVIQNPEKHFQILEGDPQQTKSVSDPPVTEGRLQLLLVQSPRFVGVGIFKDLLHGLQHHVVHPFTFLLLSIRVGPSRG